MAAKPTRAHLIREFILRNVADHPRDISSHTAKTFGVSRQTVSRHLSTLVKAGFLEAEGQTRARRYKLKPIIQEAHRLPVEGLQEDRVWRETIAPKLSGRADPNVLQICEYGATEMINNVIDHSESKEIIVAINLDSIDVEIVIADSGIGIFQKIQSELNLDDPRHALLELSKGKLTTDPEHHTGEGIYFTSLAFDEFDISSGNLYYKKFRDDDEWMIETHTRDTTILGTVIRMKIERYSDRTLKTAFDSASAEDKDFRFSRTHVPISLLKYGEENLVSRSQAKRLLARFERFEEVMLDFRGIENIGQAFADEIFRVFANRHPEIKIVALFTTPEVARMIERARAGQSRE